jgi:hypothetical protein
MMACRRRERWSAYYKGKKQEGGGKRTQRAGIIKIEMPASNDDPPPRPKREWKKSAPKSGKTEAKTERKRAFPARREAAY